MTGLLVYLAIGALVAALFWWALARRMDHPDADLAAAERVIGGLPGVMLTFLLWMALCWPVAVALFVRNRIRRR